MKKKVIKERYEKANLYLEKKQNVQLEMGSDEYTRFLESIINDLKKVKSSLRTRSRAGAAHRKEADRIQAAINAMKYLNNKNIRMINSSMLHEQENPKDNFSRSDVKNFLRTYK